MHTLSILGKGQIVIPAEIRRRYGFKSGMSVEIRDVGDHLEIHPLPSDPVAAFRGSLSGGDSLADALAEEHRREVEGG